MQDQKQTQNKKLDLENIFSLLDGGQKEKFIGLIGVAYNSYHQYRENIDKVIDFLYTVKMDYDDMAEICKEARVSDDCRLYGDAVAELDKKIENMKKMAYAIQSIYEIVNNS